MARARGQREKVVSVAGESADIYLETERMVLRRMTPRDVDNLVELDSDPEVLRHISGGRPTSRRTIEERVLPRMLSLYHRFPGYGYWAAIDKRNGEFLGWLSLYPADEHSPEDAV